MVFKGRFFSSRHKSSESSSSPDGSNSPRTPTSAPGASAASPASSSASSRSDKKKPKSETPRKRDKLFGSASAAVPVPSPRSAAASSATSSPSADARKAAAAQHLRDAGGGGASSAAALSPILASSLGLNKIKTKSGPLPHEGQRMAAALGSSNLARGHSQAGTSAAAKDVKKGMSSWADSSSGGSSSKLGKGKAAEQPVRSAAGTGLEAEGKSAAKAKSNAFRNHSGDLRTPPHIPAAVSAYDTCETPKESESPRFKAIMQATSAPRKRNPSDIKSFSHELNSKGVRPFPFLKPRGVYNLKEVLKVIQMRFEKAKEEVNTDLAVFAGDLVSVMEKYADSHPEWKETFEDLLILARSCSVMTPGELWLQCEGIVQDLDDQRQELPMGVLKKLYTRMLFILTRCTRLLQFHKESGFAEDEVVMDQRDKIIQSADNKILAQSGPHDMTTRSSKTDARKSYSQEQHNLKWRRSQEIKPVKILLPLDTDIKKEVDSPTRERMSSWKPFPSPVPKPPVEEPTPIKEESPTKKTDTLATVTSGVELISPVESISHQPLPPKHQHKTSWGHWSDQPNISEEGSIMCRICEEYVPTHYVENHSAVCAIADRCDQKGVSVDERLVRVAETLEKLVDSYSQKDIINAVSSPDAAKVSNPSINEESDGPSPKLSDWSRRGSADMLDYLQEADNTISLDDIKNLPSMTCKTRFGPKSDHGMATSSAGSMTPRSPLTTPRSNHIDMLLAGRSAINESDDLPQIVELADIARCIANTPLDEESALSQLVTCIEDLQEIVNRRKHEALTVQTFGTRIEKLHREKYLQLCDSVDMDKVDSSSTIMDEEDDVVRSLRASPVHPVKDRTSIDDFEIIKPISRGAFGRVFLAKKRTTGDLFAIKVLRKADMIRKNAVESILAERDILITVRNPFVVRFFYSFTSRENLYLVMEYLNGGDLYSLLRNLGCLDEDVARVYLAEVVLALEYLHSMQIVHRDLKPDNLLIAHDGHVKLTDFGLSKVGLINSTDDLSGPAVSGASLYGDDEPQMNELEEMDHRARRQKRSAVGTPDYLAPEILLGTGHGTSADWWSVGVILFELLVGIPPFNAEHPQTIFDNILNRKIPWPHVPEEMSFEAKDLIDKFLTEDPHQRLGSNGASEVKQHSFFKDVSWDTLARQKAAFVPSSDSAFDTSYFTSRYSWNPSDENIYEAYECEDSSDNGSLSGSSSCVSNHQDDMGDERGEPTEYESGPNVNYSFSNFSFKNLSQLASINYDLLTKGLKDEPPTKSET